MIFALSGKESEKRIFSCLASISLDFQNATCNLDVCGIECCLWNNRFLQRGCWEPGENWQVFCKLWQSSIVATTFENNFQICRLRLLHVDYLIRWFYDDHWLQVVGDVPAWKGWGLSAKLGKHSAIWGKLGTALQAYTLNPCTKFPPNPTSRKVNT